MFLFDRLFVGAPRGNYTKRRLLRRSLDNIKEPGVVYRCALPSAYFGPCVEIEPAFINDERVLVYQQLPALLMKEYAWFGAAMSVEPNSGFLTVRFAGSTISYPGYSMLD